MHSVLTNPCHSHLDAVCNNSRIIDTPLNLCLGSQLYRCPHGGHVAFIFILIQSPVFALATLRVPLAIPSYAHVGLRAPQHWFDHWHSVFIT